MGKIDELKRIYNEISDEEIDSSQFDIIIPKLELIQSYIKLDLEEEIELIDVLLEFNKYGKLSNINMETLNLVNKIVDKNNSFIDNELYYPLYLKHILLSYNINKCKNEYDLMMFLTEFENVLNIISKKFNQEDLKVLNKYNHELAEISMIYRNYEELGKDNDINIIISHIIGLFYFKLDLYNIDLIVLEKIIHNIVDNDKEVIDYLKNEEILSNLNSLNPDSEKLNKEYEISGKIIDLIFSKEEIKRKCR